jgi:hypothetical protein
VSDWVAPIYEGRFMGVIPIDEANREHIGAMMAGINPSGTSLSRDAQAGDVPDGEVT